MKKTISFLLFILLAFFIINTSVYASTGEIQFENELLTNAAINYADQNGDGIVTEEEAKNITVLSIDGNIYQEDGSVISTYISNLNGIENFVNLESLYIYGVSGLESLSGIENLEKIKNLSINNAPDLKDVSQIGNFRNLEMLSIVNTSISDISFLSFNKALKKVGLEKCYITNIDSLKDITSIEKLHLSDISTISNINIVNTLTNLKELSFYRTGIKDISVIKDLTSLEIFRAENLDITNLEYFKDLINLTQLYLVDGELEDISGIENLTKLQYLTLSKNKIEDIRALETLINIEYLSLDHNNIVYTNSICNLINLRYLNLSDNFIKEAGLYEEENSYSFGFFYAPNMTTIDISNNPISNIEFLTNLNTTQNLFVDTDVNPYDEATFAIMCNLKEFNREIILGDCSRFVPKEDENGLTYILNKEKTGYILTGTNVEDLTEIIIPSQIDGLPVLEIADNAFQRYLPEEELTLTKIVLNESLEIIGDNAFSGQQNISGEIIFPTTLKKIGKRVFESSKISKISLNEGLEYIGDNCFAYCKRINGELYLPDTLTYIGSCVFDGCVNIDGTIKIPKKIYEIKNSTFSNCRNIDRIDFGEKLEVIGDNAFSNCIQLKGELILPPKLKKLGENAFAYCRLLKGKVVIPEGVETMTSAFSYCDNIEEIVLHNNIKEIASYAFRGLKLKKKIVLPDSVEKISWVVFESFEGVNDDLIIPNNVKTFEPYAMFADSNIKNVVLPAKIDTIPFRTFYLSNVESIVFPREVEKVTIEDEVFDGCLTIEKIIIYDNVKEIEFANEEVIFSPENGFSEDFAIYGYTGTYAEEYAKEKGYKFVAMNGNTLKETDNVEVNGETISVMPIDNLTKIEEVLNVENFPTIGDHEIVVVDKNGNEKDATQKLGSRDVIQIKDDEGNVIEEHVVIVNGDVNGDGEIKMYDSFQILKGSIMNSNNDAIETLIRDKNGDGKVMMYDAFQFLKQAIIG